MNLGEPVVPGSWEMIGVKHSVTRCSAWRQPRKSRWLIKVTQLLNFQKLHFSLSLSSAILAWSSILMVDYDNNFRSSVTLTLTFGSGQGHVSMHNTYRATSIPDHVTLASSNSEIWPFESPVTSTFCLLWSHVIATRLILSWITNCLLRESMAFLTSGVKKGDQYCYLCLACAFNSTAFASLVRECCFRVGTHSIRSWARCMEAVSFLHQSHRRWVCANVLSQHSWGKSCHMTLAALRVIAYVVRHWSGFLVTAGENFCSVLYDWEIIKRMADCRQ